MKKIILILSFSIICNIFITAQSIIKIQPAENFSQKSSMNMDMSMKMFGKGMSTKSKFYCYTKYRGLDADNNLKFDVRLDSFITNVKADDNDITINSNDKESMEQNEKLASMKEYLGKDVVVTMTQFGKIINKEGDETAPNFVEGMFIELPEKGIKVKDKWSVETTKEVSGMEVSTITEYTIMEINASEIKIKSESSSEMLGDEPIIANYIIDAKTGIVKSYSSNANMKIMGIKMKMDINYKTD